MDVIGSVTYGRLAAAVVEAEAARHQIQQTAGQGFRDVRDAVFDRNAGSAEQVDDVGCDSHAGVFDELEGFAENFVR